MRDHSKVIGSNQATQAYRGPYHEIAVYIRDLLECDYGLVAVPEKHSIRIHAVAVRPGEAYGNLATTTLLSQLQDWGPVVVDDARLIAAPVYRNGHLIGVLIGYSSKSGTFTADDLEKLMAYTPVAAAMLENAVTEVQDEGDTKTTFTDDELLHFSRLITIGQLSACFAHEVTNPLTLIRGHLRFIEESLAADHPLRMSFDVIDRASRRIEEMAKRMLDFSKKRTRQPESFDIADVISDALRFVQPYFRSYFIDVQVQLDPQLPPITGDRWQLVQAIVNLLQNAGDAMVGVDRRILSINAGVENEQVRIAVSDTGTGILPGNQSKIFEPFFTTKGNQGTGLGLYIAKQVIEEHRGTVDVRTSTRGTSFVISLPL
jgi:signal transduction histidine kinase